MAILGTHFHCWRKGQQRNFKVRILALVSAPWKQSQGLEAVDVHWLGIWGHPAASTAALPRPEDAEPPLPVPGKDNGPMVGRGPSGRGCPKLLNRSQGATRDREEGMKIITFFNWGLEVGEISGSHSLGSHGEWDLGYRLKLNSRFGKCCQNVTDPFLCNWLGCFSGFFHKFGLW